MPYGDENPYAGYDPGGVTPQELLARLMKLQSRVAATISLVERNEEGMRERQAKFEIDLDAITASVIDITTDIDGIDAKIGALEVTAESITATVLSEVERIDGSVSSAFGQIQVLSDNISSKVSQTDFNGNTVSSLINQSATAIKIKAEKIEFYGQVFGEGATFSGAVLTQYASNFGYLDGARLVFGVGDAMFPAAVALIVGSDSADAQKGRISSGKELILSSPTTTITGNLNVQGNHNIVARFG